jgi:MFS family permease
MGDAFSNVAMPLLVLRVTGSVAQMGAVSGASTMAQLFGGLLAGPVVDRLDRRRVLIGCDVVQMVLGASIPVMWWLATPGEWHRFAMWLIYPVVVASSVLISLSTVGLHAAIPQIVGPDELLRANGRLTVAVEVAYGCGPMIAGVTVAALGEPSAIGINALTYGVSALAWCWVRLRPVASSAYDEPAASPVRTRLAGLRFLWHDRQLRGLTQLELGNGFLIAGSTSLFIYYVSHDLGAGSVLVGLLLTLASGGAVLAALAAPWLRTRWGLGRTWLAALGVEGLALACVGVTRSLWGIAALAVVFALGQITAIILATTYRQERSPDTIRGRVTASVLTIMLAARGTGAVLSTTAASRFSARDVFVAMGVAVLVLAAVGTRMPLPSGATTTGVSRVDEPSHKRGSGPAVADTFQ